MTRSLDPRANPALSDAACLANYNLISPAVGPAFNSTNPNAICSRDIYTAGTAPGGVGWNKPQNLAGNRLPNSPLNKIAINVMYTWNTDWGSISPSISYVWRGSQYGTLFTRSYNKAPSWDQWDARVRWVSSDERWEGIFFGRNIFNKIGYDSGAVGNRLAGTVNNLAGTPTNFVQGLNGPAGYGAVRGEDSTGHVTTYYVTPPATFGVELHYKFD